MGGGHPGGPQGTRQAAGHRHKAVAGMLHQDGDYPHYPIPRKGAELWAYQTTILRAAQNYEGATWVAYDRQYHRDMLSRKYLNWSAPNAHLYNEAFTGRANVVPRCPHSLCEDHSGANCPHNPNPMLVGWLPNPARRPLMPTRPNRSPRPR